MSQTQDLPLLFQTDRFVARRKILTLAGATFHIFDEQEKVLAYSRQKAFRLKEDIRIYADEEKSQELLNIKADRVIDFSAAYTVIDATTNEQVGSLRRKGMSSILRDTWEILNVHGEPRGKILEDNATLALLRRVTELFSLIFPQAYRMEVDGVTVANVQQHRNPFVHKYSVTVEPEGDRLPRPLLVAAVILLLAIEGRQT